MVSGLSQSNVSSTFHSSIEMERSLNSALFTPLLRNSILCNSEKTIALSLKSRPQDCPPKRLGGNHLTNQLLTGQQVEIA